MNLKEREALFQNPTNEFRGKPFWSWNGKLEEKELKKQIDVMKEMGFGGYFMHSRTGLETEYLGEEWFSYINECADYGANQGMEAWLYDEDRWPSGSAGGIVTKEKKFRAMFLTYSLKNKIGYEKLRWSKQVIAVFAVIFDKGKQKDGIYTAYRRLKEGEMLKEGEFAAVFRIRYSRCTDNYNGYCYLNTMSKEAVEQYLAVTHERYLAKCKKRFGSKIKGIFTDEPHRGPCFSEFSEGSKMAVPYTPDLFDEFKIRFGYDLEDNLPALFLRCKTEKLSKLTRDYFELCQQLFLERFAIPIQKWCRENDMLFTGHVLHEDSLSAQAAMQGSLMRFYEYMDYPGIDVLTEDNRCYFIAKQVDSVARQLNKPWVLSELYGCTGWQMSFEAYKNIGDWQALFGINLRCQHLSWYTMKGEAKRDYPASILHQSAWYKEFAYLEDYHSRIHAALWEGRAECELLVLNPIESVWARAYAGAFDGIAAADQGIEAMEKQYAGLCNLLAGNRIDFDYGEEDIMARHGSVDGGQLRIGEISYRKVLVTGVDTIRKTTLALLTALLEQGGEVIFAGDVPVYVDVERSDAVRALAARATYISMDEDAIVKACKSGNEIVILQKENPLIFARSMKIEGGRMVMLLNTDRRQAYSEVEISLGEGTYVEQWDPRTGKVTRVKSKKTKEGLLVVTGLEAGGERLYLVTDFDRKLEEKEAWNETTIAQPLPKTYSYTLSEQNICVLDQVCVRAKDAQEHILTIGENAEEVLRADQRLRDLLHIPYRGGEMLQPWYEVKYKNGNKQRLAELNLEYTVEIADLPKEVSLVVEEIEHITAVFVNGNEVQPKSTGKWIDVCFDQVAVPDSLWKKGSNQITIQMDYYKTSGIEAVYLLGNFGVSIHHKHQPVLETLCDKISIGDITAMGLPFYSGSIRYHIEGMEGKTIAVKGLSFGGALAKLCGDTEEVLAFPPYQAKITNLRAIEIILTRRNTFGPLHQLPKKATAYGSFNFLTKGAEWTGGYQLYEQGLLQQPEIMLLL